MVEAWIAHNTKGQVGRDRNVFANRTPIVGDEISAYRNVDSKLLLLAGCGLDGVGLDNWPLGDVTAALHIAIAGRNGRRLGRLPIDSSGISRETETALRRALVKSRDRLPLDMPEPQELPPPTRPPKVEPPPKLPREVYQPLGVGGDLSGSNVGRVGVKRGSGRTGVWRREGRSMAGVLRVELWREVDCGDALPLPELAVSLTALRLRTAHCCREGNGNANPWRRHLLRSRRR